MEYYLQLAHRLDRFENQMTQRLNVFEERITHQLNIFEARLTRIENWGVCFQTPRRLTRATFTPFNMQSPHEEAALCLAPRADRGRAITEEREENETPRGIGRFHPYSLGIIIILDFFLNF
jgi:hypothetical protein